MRKNILVSVGLIGLVIILTLNVRLTSKSKDNNPVAVSIKSFNIALAQPEWCENGIKDKDDHTHFVWGCMCYMCDCLDDLEDCCICE
jgi:hypothetical protein